MNSDKLTKTSDEKLFLVNIVEEYVRAKVREAMHQTEICQCETCQLNICAIVLNSFPPKYETTTKGTLLAQIGLLTPDFQMQTIIQVYKAVKIVKECPMHE